MLWRLEAHPSIFSQPSALFGPRHGSNSRPASSRTTATCSYLCASIPIVIIVHLHLADTNDPQPRGRQDSLGSSSRSAPIRSNPASSVRRRQVSTRARGLSGVGSAHLTGLLFLQKVKCVYCPARLRIPILPLAPAARPPSVSAPTSPGTRPRSIVCQPATRRTARSRPRPPALLEEIWIVLTSSRNNRLRDSL